MARTLMCYAFVALLLIPSLAQGAEKKVIIGFRKTSALTELEKQDRVHRAGGRVERSHAIANALTADLPEEAIRSLKEDPDVSYVEEDREFSAEPAFPEPELTPEYLLSWGVTRIAANRAAWNGIRGAGIKVAILDTGIDYNHPELKESYRGGYNFLTNTADPYDDSRRGHGTHIAGVIAAKDNGTGVVGVAPDASLYAVKILDRNMFGSTSRVLAGLEWAIANTVDVINISFSMPNDPMFFSQAVKDACDEAYAAGIVVVAAAGNSGRPVVDYPADFASVIAVAATAADDTRAFFSNYGAKIEFSAPGVGITSTLPGGRYGLLSGTSQAAPHVAGAVALLLSTGVVDDSGQDAGKVEAVRNWLAAGALDLGEPDRDATFGHGLVQAPAYWTVRRTPAPPWENALILPVTAGKHRVDVVNHGLKRLVIKTPQGVQDVMHLPEGNWAHQETYFSFEYESETADRITFYPYGSVGSSAEIGISAH
uniref:Peptidase S8 and S53 subtilisin kexin sedolisin n=1 Tax=Geobacter sp. (strain M21) TaxID=443144 RepID=C6E383_GEOSM